MDQTTGRIVMGVVAALLLATPVLGETATPVDTGETADTGLTPADTDTDSDTDSDTDTDTDTDTDGGTTDAGVTTEPIEYCTDCSSAADLAGEQGGNPCADGCATTGPAPAGALWLPLLWVVGRRRS